MGRKRKWLIVIVIVALLAITWHWGSGKILGLTEWDYRRVNTEMSKEEVIKILGLPNSAIAKSPVDADMELYIYNKTGKPLTEATEVWRWKRFIQIIGVVYDHQGRVIYKWVDY